LDLPDLDVLRRESHRISRSPWDWIVALGGTFTVLLVRHPIYLGYFVTHVGFLLANWSPRNIALYIVTCFFQISRILAEERILREDESYRAYCQRVRYRVVPFIF